MKSLKKIRKMSTYDLLQEVSTQEYIVEAIGYEDMSKQAQKERMYLDILQDELARREINN